MTPTQRHLSRRYLAYRASKNMFFLGAVWLYLYRLFITDAQVGILEGIAFGFGLLAEVPSGALADRFGRGRLTRLGQALAGGGLAFQACGSSFAVFLFGQTLMMIGVAFASGADEALFYDKLNFSDTTDWRKLVAKGTQLSLITLTLAIVVGGWLHTINPRIPWFLTAAAFLISVAFVWGINDQPRRSGDSSSGLREYLRDIGVGFRQFRLPVLWAYVPIILVVQGALYAADWGLLRMVFLSRFGFSPLAGAIASACISLITTVVLALTNRYAHRLSEKRVLTTITLVVAGSLAAAAAPLGMWGFVVILALHTCENVLYPFVSEILNTHAPAQHRATVLSVASFLKALPYIGLGPLIGGLNSAGQLHYFLLSWPLLIGGVLMLYLLRKRRDTIIETKLG